MSKTNERPSRRLALLGDRPGSYAIARHVRMSPMKVRRVVNLVRGMDVSSALTTLKFAPQAAAKPVYKTLASAVANAESTEALRSDDLYVSQIFVDEGMTLRRIRPRAKGSASQILKRSSHITVVVEPKEEPAPKKKTETKKSTAKKSESKKSAAKKTEPKKPATKKTESKSDQSAKKEA